MSPAGGGLRDVVLHLYACALHPELVPTVASARLDGAGRRARVALLPSGGFLVEVGSLAPPGGRAADARARQRRLSEVRALVVEPVVEPLGGAEPSTGTGLPEAGRLDRRSLGAEPRGSLDDQVGALRLRLGWSLERLDPLEVPRAHARLVAAPAPPGGRRLVHDGGHPENEARGRWSRLDASGEGAAVEVLAALLDPASGALVVVQLEARWDEAPGP